MSERSRHGTPKKFANFQRRARNRSVAVAGGTMIKMPEQVVSPLLEIPIETRDLIAHAVHAAVDGVSVPKGGGRCFYYMAAACAIFVCRFKEYKIYPQAGSLLLQADPNDDLSFEINAETPDSLAAGEFHCWLISPEGVVLDFSARDYKGMVENSSLRSQLEADRTGSAFGSGRSTDERAVYRQPHLEYLWEPWSAAARFVHFRPDPTACDFAMKLMVHDPGAKTVQVRAVLAFDRGQ
jgi:hypothetical protein